MLSPSTTRWARRTIMVPILCTVCLFVMVILPRENITSNSRPQWAMPWDTCTPRRKIAFAKTHKTASSTVQNILLRYGLTNNAEFLLPWVNNYLGNMLKPFTVEQMDRADQTKVPWHRTLRKSPGGYDISCFHCKWNDTAMRYLIGQEAVFLTILREPVSQFESLFTYYKLEGAMTIQEYINKRLRHEPNPVSLWLKDKGQSRFNTQLRDLGYNGQDIGANATKLAAVIRDVDQHFDLVMLSERMDESMVLMADALCLPLEEVTSLKNNVRKKDKIQQMTEDEKSVIARFQRPDQGTCALYEYFNNRLDEKIAAYGESRMVRDVARLRALNQQLYDKCVVQDTASSGYVKLDKDMRPYNGDTVAYSIRENVTGCHLAAMTELPLVDKVKGVQRQRWKLILQTQENLPGGEVGKIMTNHRSA